MLEHDVGLGDGFSVFGDHKGGPGTGVLTGFDVALGISDHPALREIDVPFLRRLDQHGWGWLAARGAFFELGRVVDVVELHFSQFMHPALQLLVQMEQRILRHHAFADSLLVGDHDSEIPALFYRLHGLCDLLEQFEFIPGLHITAIDTTIDDAIAVEENSFIHLPTSVRAS